MLAINSLCKSYSYAEARQDVLQQLDFAMAAASSVALLGDSGSGKSTLLHLIAGLDRPDSGEILFAGHRIHADPESNSGRHAAFGIKPGVSAIPPDIDVDYS